MSLAQNSVFYGYGYYNALTGNHTQEVEPTDQCIRPLEVAETSTKPSPAPL